MREKNGMDFALVEAFLAVVQRGGFTRAAESLHLSQPALSRRIGLLEQELGRPAFERGRRGAKLTEAGRVFLPHAEAALACVRDGLGAVRALDGGATHLALAIVGTLAGTGVTPALSRFRREHPSLRVALRTGNSAEVSSLVRRGEAALGLRYFADPRGDLISVVVGSEPLVVVAPADHPLASARRIQASRLAAEAWVVFPAKRGNATDPFGQTVAGTIAGAGLDSAERVVVDSLTAQKRLVEAGFGLALVPRSSVQEELAHAALCVLDVPALQTSIDIALIHRSSAPLDAAAADLIALLANADGARDAPTKRRPRRLALPDRG